MNKYIKIIGFFLMCSVVLTLCSSCLDRKPSVPGEDVIKATDENIGKKTFVLSEWEYKGKKKSELTLEDINSIIKECEELYVQYDRIEWCPITNLNHKIEDEGTVKDCVDVSDVNHLSCIEYKDYLSDLTSMIVYRLMQTCDENLCYSEKEWRMINGREWDKNSLIYASFIFFSDPLNGMELPRDERVNRVYEAFNNVNEDYLWMASTGVDDYFYPIQISSGTEEKNRVVFPTAEQEATLNAIKAREAAEKP